MRLFLISSAAALSLALAACGESQSPPPENAGSGDGSPTAEAGGEVYSASGHVTELSPDRITISHGPVEGLGWPGMTMTFQVSSPGMLGSIAVGDRVDFQFGKSGSDYVVTAISKAQ